MSEQKIQQVKLDSGEMVDFLQHIIDNNRYIQELGKVPVATEVIGDAGLGKTSVLLKLAEQNNLDCVKINLAQIEELGDLVGFPIRQFEMCKEGEVSAEIKPAMKTIIKEVKLPNGLKIKKKVEVEDDSVKNPKQTSGCLWVDENAVNQYEKQGFSFTGRKRMSYCPPEWIADKKEGGILLLDDWTRGDQRFIQACMDLIDRQEYISWKLPKDWHIVLSGNPDDGEYMVNSIDDAQRTRFISVVMQWNSERWAEWAEQNNIDGRCINFVLMHPEIVGENKGVNPRSITKFFDSISSFKVFEEKLPMIQMIGEGSVGPEVSLLFTTFINNRLDKLVSPKELLLGKGDDAVAKKLYDAIYNADSGTANYRADIASIMTTRLINYTLNYAEKNKITDDHINRLIHFIKDPDIFTDDLKYHLVKKILNGNKNKFQKLIFDSAVQEYATK